MLDAQAPAQPLSPDLTHFVTTVDALATRFVCYGLSCACMAGTLAALFRHGTRSAGSLREKLTETRASMVAWSFCGGVGLLSASIAPGAIYTGSVWPIVLAGCSCSLLRATGVARKRYRSGLRTATPP